jgi:hypothetical protein
MAILFNADRLAKGSLDRWTANAELCIGGPMIPLFTDLAGEIMYPALHFGRAGANAFFLLEFLIDLLAISSLNRFFLPMNKWCA